MRNGIRMSQNWHDQVEKFFFSPHLGQCALLQAQKKPIANVCQASLKEDFLRSEKDSLSFFCVQKWKHFLSVNLVKTGK